MEEVDRQCAETQTMTIRHSLSHSCSQNLFLSSFSPAVPCVLWKRKQSHDFLVIKNVEEDHVDIY